MNYNILNFLPYYPDINDSEFNGVVYSKKEFNELSVPAYEKFPTMKGDLLTHQKLISRLLSSKTPYKGILLMHDMGTGKTCSASAIIEQIRNENSSIKQFYYIAKNTSLLTQFEDQFREKCTKTDMSDISKLANIGLKTMTHVGFAKTVLNSTSRPKTVASSLLNNSLIILDEVHNIRESSDSLYDDYKLILQSLKNSKVVLMSGTPMTDTANEFASVMNLILPPETQLPTGNDFDNTFINGNKLINTQQLRDSIKGRISYIKTMQTNVIKRFNGEILSGFVTEMKLSQSFMSDLQSKHYNIARQLDASDLSRSPAYTNSLRASDFVTSNGEYGLAVNEKAFRFSGSTRSDILKELGTFSSKYKDSLETILQARSDNKCSFVFNKNVSGGGLNMFARILDLVGYKKVTPSSVNNIKSDKNARRYILLTGETTDKESLIRRFNNDDNVDGSVISVVLASDAISEGYSFNNIQVIDIHSPWFNFAKTSQAIARGIRTGSHAALEKQNSSKIFVDIYLRVSIPSEGDSIDVKTYNMSEKKDVIIKEIEHLIKEESVDSRLAYNRNTRNSDQDNTRDCDYTLCKYSPFPNERNIKYETDYSTFEDYDNTDTTLVEKIKDMIKSSRVISMDTVKDDLLNEFDEFQIISVIVDIINNDTLFNIEDKKFFLREDRNMLYLTDSISNKTSIFDSYYNINNHSEIIETPPEDVIESPDTQIDTTKITSLFDLNMKINFMDPMEKELLLEDSIIQGLPNEFIKEKFKDLHGLIGAKYYSWYLLSEKIQTVRVFENETWNDGDDDDMTIVNKELETRIATVRDKAKTIFDPLSENNDVFYGIYGYTDEFTKGKKIKKFSIVKIIESADKRVLSTGKDCTSWVGADSKMQLEYILTTLGSSSTEAGKNLGERCNKIETLFNDKGILLRNI